MSKLEIGGDLGCTIIVVTMIICFTVVMVILLV